MTAISCRTLRGSLPMCDPAAVCLRTLLGTSRWGSTRCWLTWTRSATPAGRLLFRLALSERRIDGTGSGSSLSDETLWWTPTAAVGKIGGRLTPRMGERPLELGGNLLNQMARRESVQPGDRLSVEWTTGMMGFPDGWLDGATYRHRGSSVLTDAKTSGA
jgi:hypothetical protein